MWAPTSSGWSRIARAEFGDRLVQLTLFHQGVRQADTGADVFGLEPDRLAEFRDRLVQLRPLPPG